MTADWVADLVYPLLAGVSALMCVLALGWHYVPPRPRHPLNLVVAIIGFAMIWPAVLASKATGLNPVTTIDGVRAWLRLAWLAVALCFCLPVGYYAFRYYRAVMTYHRAIRDAKRCWRLKKA